jgi:NADH dehydrogenase FAD-containing subunit
VNSCDKVVNVEYDRLVMAVGASQNDLKIKGANNALSLKDYQGSTAAPPF